MEAFALYLHEIGNFACFVIRLRQMIKGSEAVVELRQHYSRGACAGSFLG